MVKLSPNPVSVATPSLDAEIVIEDDRWRSIAECETAIAAAIRALATAQPPGLQDSAMATIVLSNDVRLAELNAAFRHKQGPTNVLSFPADRRATLPGEPSYLGDVIIAHETVLREAGDLDLPLRHHLQHLAIHGVLHLLGFDHIADADAAAMEALETRVLRSLGIADPYACPPDNAE